MSLLRHAAATVGSVSRRAFSTESRLRVKTFNNISSVGLGQFDAGLYDVSADHDAGQAIILRSQKLTPEDIPIETRCIARCGAGTNNCQVDLMTDHGVPVFNTPGSNANAVKELVLCSLFLASRGIIAGAEHMAKLHAAGTASERVEKDKSMFAGQEVAGKTLGVIGLGHIGASVVRLRAVHHHHWNLPTAVVTVWLRILMDILWKLHHQRYSVFCCCCCCGGGGGGRRRRRIRLKLLPTSA